MFFFFTLNYEACHPFFPFTFAAHIRAVVTPMLHDEKGFDVFLRGTGKVPLVHTAS